ncbi:MAG TPA: hypothetical protein VFA98_00030 [Thermoanaerobaculia bacterium]|nr:hypothetical protein [Thermoanaerobaculia bacterium]
MAGALTNMPNVRRWVLAAAAALTAAATAYAPAAAQSSGEVTETSRPLRLLRSWEETVKLAGGAEEPRRVQVFFDYDKGAGYEAYSTLDGEPLGTMTLGLGHPSPSQVEIDEAFRLVREDPEFARIFRRFKVVFEGGFILTEGRGRPCGPGSRCLRVFLLSSDRAGTIRQVVVDLVKQRVVDDDFNPGATRGRAQ